VVRDANRSAILADWPSGSNAGYRIGNGIANVKSDWKGKRVTILGGARQGQSAARWLVRHGSLVTVNDRGKPDEMDIARATLSDLPVVWVLGIICLSGGVPLTNPLVVEATRLGIPLTNDTQIFLENVPCQTIGITGSAGKTTTTTLVGQMARNALGDRVHVGGNIGDPLLNYVDKMRPDDLAVLEISSFQLELMTLSPNVASILNITPNHLDRHGSMEVYSTSKQRILDFQATNDTAVLGRDDPGSWNLRGKVKGRIYSFGFGHLPGKQEGSYLANGNLCLREDGREIPLLRRDQIQLRGEHNVMNMLAAFTIGYAAGLPVAAMVETAKDFRGVAHRLEFVRELKGSKWYNDSIATAPERTIAAILSFSEPIILLLGGRDKNLPWDKLAVLVHERVDRVVLFGEAAERIAAELEKAPVSFKKPVERCIGLEEAIQVAALKTKPGEIILLSPGGTSFDQFRDFEERGEAFRKWVSELL
jgi:UDP-N-acetylmuramoylalanine--D-glutamate ligase